MTVFNEAKKIFISHHHSQAAALSELKSNLHKIGFEAFLAHDDIEPGAHALDAIEKELMACDVFFVYFQYRI